MDEIKTENNCNESKPDENERPKDDELNENRVNEEEKPATACEVPGHLIPKQSVENTNDVQDSKVETKDVKVIQTEHPHWKPTMTPSTSQLLVEDKTSLPTFRFMSLKAKVGICHRNYPHSRLSLQQMSELREDIEKRIVSPEGYRVKPRFFGTKPVDGCLVIVCGDLSTVSWVKSLPQKMGSLVGVPLKTVDRPPQEKTFVAVGYFTNSLMDTNETILRYLAAQNEGMSFSKWKVMDRNPDKKAVRLTFSLDSESAELLKKKGPNLNFKFGRARFQLRHKRGSKFMEEDSNEDYDDDDEVWSIDEKKPRLAEGGVKSEPEDFLGRFLEDDDYNHRVALAVKQSKGRLKLGMTSRERYRMGKKGRNRNKKKKKLKAETELSYDLGFFPPYADMQLNPMNIAGVHF